MNSEYSHWQNQAKLKFNFGQYQESFDLWEKCLELEPNDLINYAYIGLIYFLENDQESAQENWFNCLLNGTEDELNDISNLIYEIANQQQQQNNFILATQLYEQVLQFNENHVLSNINLGYLLAIRGDLDNAFNCWQNATEIDSNLSIAYYHQARQYEGFKDYQSAIDNYKQALKLKKDNTFYWHKLGICLLENQQLDLAINAQEKCLEIEDDFGSAYGELGYISLLNFNLEKAINYWQLLVLNKPTLFNHYLAWLQEINNNNYSLKLVLLLIEYLISNSGDKNYHQLLTIIGDLFYQKKLYEKAIYYYQLAIKNNIQLGENYYHLIISLAYTNQPEQISEFLEKLAKIDNDKYQQIIQLFKNKNLDENKLIKAPQNYQEKLYDYLKIQNLLKDNFYPIYVENIINLLPPKTTEKYIHPSFQFSPEIQLPASFVGILPEGRYWLREDEASSAVISHDNQIIGDLSPESPALSPGHPDSHPSNHYLLKNNLLPPIEYIDGTVVVLLGLLNKVYFHWLFDIVPRFNLLKLSGIDLEKVDYFLVDNSCDFQKETLSILGIKPEKIKQLSLPLHIQAKKLIIPSFPGTIAWMPRWSLDYLKEVILENFTPETNGKKRIYISRKNANNRRLINEEEIINLLKNHQFEVVNLEDICVKEQAKLLASTEIVVSLHGSGLSNLVFCQPETKVIEIFTPFYVYPCYWLISNLLNLDYYYLLGEIWGSQHFHQLIYPDSRAEDIYLNPKKLNSILESILTDNK